MNLILNVNTNLHSIKGSMDGELKAQAAVAEAMEEIKIQALKNQERIKRGLQPLSYNTVIKDEYGKDLVIIKETKSLGEIRDEYRKKQGEFRQTVRQKRKERLRGDRWTGSGSELKPNITDGGSSLRCF